MIQLPAPSDSADLRLRICGGRLGQERGLALRAYRVQCILRAERVSTGLAGHA